MKDKLLHTPEGVRDIYNSECKKKLIIQDKLHHVLELYGYHDIQTPTFEFFDIFNRERGSVSSKDMYKFFDREGNTLVLRPDMTPSIARCVAKYYEEEEQPIRLSYIGNTFINNTSYQGKLKENTHLGAELINDDSSAADGEIIAMIIDCFKAAGLRDFQIELGQVDFFKGLVEEAGIDMDTEEELRELIENKNFFGVEDLLSGLSIEQETKDVLMKFNELYGGLDILDKAKQLTRNNRARKAVERLSKVYQTLSYYGLEQHVSFDLGMLSQYNYYTGIIFKGYTYGTGDALVKGGRYNNLLKQFGKNSPSIGFVFVVDELMMALSRQKIEIDTDDVSTMILYRQEHQKLAVELSGHFRNQDMAIELIRQSSKKELEEYMDYAKANKIGGILYLNQINEITVIALDNNTKNTMNIEEFMKGVNP